MSDDELAQRLADAAEVERQVSGQRRTIHRVIDELQSELASRTA